MLRRSFEWYQSTKSPAALRVREFVGRHNLLRLTGRAAISVLLNPGRGPRALRELIFPQIDSKLRAIMDARAVGGPLSLSDMHQLIHALQRSRRALCIGDEQALEQINIVSRAARRSLVVSCRTVAEAGMLYSKNEFDLVVLMRGAEAVQFVAGLCRTSPACTTLLPVCEAPVQGWHTELRHPTPKALVRHEPVLARSTCSLPSSRNKSLQGGRFRVVLLNDTGFRLGAGTALKRQAASFLLNGWGVSVVAHDPGSVLAPPFVTGVRSFENWHGFHRATDNTNGRLGDEQIAAEVVSRVEGLHPNIVILGNLHAANWPISLLSRLRERGLQVIAYMHDASWITGRCAHPGLCTLFQSGCDASCPTANEYPRLAPEKIANAWQTRADLFTGPAAIPLVANSKWTLEMIYRRFGNAARANVIHLGLDHKLFAPMQKSVARALLKIPDNKIVIAMGSTDVRNRWKGGPLFHELHKLLVRRSDTAIVLFGGASQQLRSARSFGLVRDERLMALIYSAADIFVSAATEESFGQTLSEASACGRPVVAFDVGGVRDTVVHEHTGLLAQRRSVEGLLAAIDQLIHDPAKREQLGENGRRCVEQKFTLSHQADAWADYVKTLC